MKEANVKLRKGPSTVNFSGMNEMSPSSRIMPSVDNPMKRKKIVVG
jgi:hypothetical protein